MAVKFTAIKTNGAKLGSELDCKHSRKFKLSRKLGRKGFTYLLVTSFLVVVLLSIFFAASSYKYQDQESLQQVRIRAMNDFVRNLNTDIHRATYISAFRAMLALEDHVTTTGQYLLHTNESFRETFFYGTINGTSSSIMLNSTFSDYLSRVQEMAKLTGITLNISVTNIRLTQSDPWEINVFMMMNITATDNRRTASWNINKEYETVIPIDTLRDPLYSKNTFNRVPNTIRRSPDMLVNGTNTTVLQRQIADSDYIASAYAPNFLMRFEGNNNPDPNGIESIVDITDLSDQEIPVFEDRVKIDYIYFNDLDPGNKTCNVQTIPTDYYFVIPSNRVALYQIEGLNYSVACP